MLDKITGMRVFVSVVKKGSFAAAAQALTLSPQMVARHIAALEQHLATRLLNRTTRKQSITPTGQDYFHRCVAILDALDEAERAARGTALLPSGTLRLNAPVTFGRYALAPFLTAFLQRYTQLRVELTLTDALIDPLEHGIDAVIRIGELAPSLRLAAKPLSPYRLIACASPRYLEKQGTPQHPDELQQHNCLGFTPWLHDNAFHWPFTHGDDRGRVQVSGSLTINDWGAMLEAALCGGGVLLGYELALSEPLRRGELVRLLPEYAFPQKAMHLLYDPRRAGETRLRVLIDELCARFP